MLDENASPSVSEQSPSTAERAADAATDPPANGNGGGRATSAAVAGGEVRGAAMRPAGRWSVRRRSGYSRAGSAARSRPYVVRVLASLWTAANRDAYRAGLKRALDAAAGSILLLLTAPLIGLACLAIRLTSRGPAIFSQQRVGKDGKPFVMYKLRTMYVDQDKRVDMKEIQQKQANGELHKPDCDPRVTPVGLFLRKTSIDELPQIWNVFRGDMSLVGPRPLVPYMLDPYPDVKERRSRVRPGITGLWQVMARSDNRTALGMVKYDYHYVDNCSFTLDLLILFKTPFVVLGTRGAL